MKEYFLTLLVILLFNYGLRLPKSLQFPSMLLAFTVANLYQAVYFHQTRAQNYFEVLGFQEVDSYSKEQVEIHFQKKQAEQLTTEEQKMLYEAYDCLKVKQCLEQYNKFGYFLKQAESLGQ